MCYSAMVEQKLKNLGFRFKARVDRSLFEDLYRRRSQGEKLKIPRAMDFNFLDATNEQDQRINDLIEEYKTKKITSSETEMFAQRKRLADAERKLAEKPTKTAEKEKGIAERKVEQLLRDIARFNSNEASPRDSRIFPLEYAPVLIRENGERVIKPMRYMCRPQGKPEWYDTKFPGCYNARRDNLEGFWKDVFGKQHGVLVVDSFFENVKLHAYEKRELKPGETEKNIVIKFNAKGFDQILIACIWDRWVKPGSPDLWSFAAITDEPPPEIAETGHNRCPIFLKESNVERWLSGSSISIAEHQAILSDREQPYYEHALTA